MAVAKEFDVPLRFLRDLKIETSSGRNQIIESGGITILDETYNASPESVKASLDLLATKPGRKFAVLGTMLELGPESIYYHQGSQSRI